MAMNETPYQRQSRFINVADYVIYGQQKLN